MTGSARPESAPRTSLRRPAGPSSTTAGLLYGIGAYGLWGVAPLYVISLAPAGPVEIVADRVVFSLTVCLVIIAAKRSWAPLTAVFRSGRVFGALTLAALLFSLNWLTYMYGIMTGQTLDVALGSFIDPIVSVLLGVLVLKERLRPLQWSAVGIGVVAVVVLAVTNGVIPWISLIIGLTWGFYGLVKYWIGGSLDAVTSLTVETIILTPLAAAAIGWLAAAGTLTLTGFGAGHFWLLAAGGIITAVPMILFGAAARRLPMRALGLLQYVSPVLVFILAVTVFNEHMGPERWAGFGMVWLALILLIVDLLIATRRRGARAPDPSLAAEYI